MMADQCVPPFVVPQSTANQVRARDTPRLRAPYVRKRCHRRSSHNNRSDGRRCVYVSHSHVWECFATPLDNLLNKTYSPLVLPIS